MDIITSVLDWLRGATTDLVDILPDSPFAGLADGLADVPWLGWLAWLMPIGPAIQLISVWVAALAVLYLAGIILRWLKVLGD